LRVSAFHPLHREVARESQHLSNKDRSRLSQIMPGSMQTPASASQSQTENCQLRESDEEPEYYEHWPQASRVKTAKARQRA
jgi:hypothetical protein